MDEPIVTATGEEARVEINVDAERQAAALAERTRIQEIEKLGRAVNLDGNLVSQHVEAGTAVEDFRKIALDELAKRSEAAPIRSATASVTRDEGEARRAGIQAALLHRYDPAIFPIKDDLGRDFAGQTLLDLARECLEASGTRTRRLPRHEIARLALSTSDFPAILADVANKTLRQAYEAYPRTFLPFSRRRSAVDFKNINAVQLGESPSLQKVNEKGEFTHGSIAESKETYTVLLDVLLGVRPVLPEQQAGSARGLDSIEGDFGGLSQAARRARRGDCRGGGRDRAVRRRAQPLQTEREEAP